MNVYLPNELWTAVGAFAALLIVLLIGFPMTRVRSPTLARTVSWLMVVVSVTGMERYTVSQPAGFRMLAIIGILLYTMKIVVVVEVNLSGKSQLRFWQWIGFAGFWVGMRPTIFAKVPRSPRGSVAGYAWRGVRNMACGLALVLAAQRVWLATVEWDDSHRLFLATVLLLPGLSLMLHFGAFNLLASWWRWMGAECDMVFRAPLQSKSLAEFWGKRWNLAFSEMTTLSIYRPLRGVFGNAPAMFVAFAFSGILHELAISVPVRAGFGLPLLYFALHGVAMLIESRCQALAGLIHSRPWIGRIWTLAWIVIPLPILFHQPFLRGCVWPLVGI